MTRLAVTELEPGAALDARALESIQGGNGVFQGIGNGGAIGLALVEGGSIFSPTINVQTIVNTPINVQLTTILEQLQRIDTTSIIASAIGEI